MGRLKVGLGEKTFNLLPDQWSIRNNMVWFADLQLVSRSKVRTVAYRRHRMRSASTIRSLVEPQYSRGVSGLSIGTRGQNARKGGGGPPDRQIGQ
jgi:hypothetical protein